MSRFWEAATDQAGREFGHRHYRWFVGARMFRSIAPAVSTLIIITAAAAGAVWLYRSVHPDWTAAGGRLTDWGGHAGILLLAGAGVLLTLLLLVFLVALARRAWWSWWNLSRPMWWRRY